MYFILCRQPQFLLLEYSNTQEARNSLLESLLILGLREQNIFQRLYLSHRTSKLHHFYQVILTAHCHMDLATTFSPAP